MPDFAASTACPSNRVVCPRTRYKLPPPQNQPPSLDLKPFDPHRPQHHPPRTSRGHLLQLKQSPPHCHLDRAHGRSRRNGNNRAHRADRSPNNNDRHVPAENR
jgi:hypothetical protein